MAKLNHLVLKSAVSKYLPVYAENTTEDGVKNAIVLDEKKFSDEEIEEIYQAIVAQSADNGSGQVINNTKNQKAAEKKHLVTKAFRDISDFSKEYYPGEDVSHFEASRLAHLVAIEHVEFKEAE